MSKLVNIPGMKLEMLEKFGAGFIADFRFAPLNIITMVLVCMAGLILHLAVYPFRLSTVVTMVVVALAAVVFWGSGIFVTAPGGQMTEKGPAPAMAPAPEAPGEPPSMVTLDAEPLLRLEATLGEKNVYWLGEGVSIDLVFTNTGSEPVSITPFPPEIQIIRSDTGERVRLIPPGDTTAEISAYGITVNTMVWNQRDDSGARIEPGRYSVIVGGVTLQKADDTEEVQAGFGPVIELTIESP